MQRVDFLGRRLVHPGQRIDARRDQLTQLGARLRTVQRAQIDARAMRLEVLRAGWFARRPDLPARRADYRDCVLRLKNASSKYFEARHNALDALRAHLGHLNPQSVLSRGYAIVTRDDGVIVRESAELEVGGSVNLQLARGRASARIEDKD